MINEFGMDEKTLKVILTDFVEYYKYVCANVKGLQKPSKAQLRIARLLSEAPNRYILEVGRGFGKSYISNIYISWRILRNRNEKILIVSATLLLAIKNAAYVRSLFEVVPLLMPFSPSNCEGKDKVDSAIRFNVFGADTSRDNTVEVCGITGQLTGRRATFILADDVEIPDNSATETSRALLISKTIEFSDLVIPDLPSSILYLGTPQSMESIYNKIEGFQTVIIPAEVPEDASIYNGKIDPWVLDQGFPGESTDKIRFSDEILTIKKSEKGLAAYKLQYMLDVTLSDQEKYPLKLKDLICMPLDVQEAPYSLSYASSSEYKIKELPNLGFTGDSFVRPMRINDKYSKYDSIIMSIDPSGSGSDEATYAILGILNGYVYLIDVGGTTEGYSDKALLMFSNKAKEYKVNAIVLEKNWGGGIFTKLFEGVISRIYPCALYDVTSKGQKEIRIINALEPLTTNHKFVIDYSLAEREINEALSDPNKMQYSFIYQFTHLTRDKRCLAHDDRLDAVAIGVEYIKNMLGQNAEEEFKEYQKREIEKMLYEKVYNKPYNSGTSILNRR